MSESRVLSDLNESPETSSAPHSWARQHGAKHRDFSASRLQARERARQRVQRAIQEERERVRQQAENWRAGDPAGVLDTPDDSSQAQHAAVAPPGTPSAKVIEIEFESSRRQVKSESSSADQRSVHYREESAPSNGHPAERVEEHSHGDWFTSHAEDSGESHPHAPADTLQGVRDRLASRWFALKLFDNAASAAASYRAPAATATSTSPVLAVFSLAGGVGKTSLVATLARTLSASGERVLLVETTPYGMLPFFFGARDRRFGVLRTFVPPDAGAEAPVQMVALDTDSLAAQPNGDNPLATEIARCGQSAGRTIIDIATASAAVARRLLHIAPMVLVPVVPDMNSVVNVGAIDDLLHRKSGSGAHSSEVYYVLNQFDPSLPLHLDVREVLRERLGDRLLPFTLRRAPAVSEALAEGMTVVDYAPASLVAEDFNNLAAWIKARSASAGASAHGLRWAER